MKNKWKEIMLAITGLGAIAGPIITNKVNKDHEQTVLKEQHNHDINKANQAHVHSTHGYKETIDILQQQIKVKQEELDIAKGAYGASENKILELTAELMRKEKLLAFYMKKDTN